MATRAPSIYAGDTTGVTPLDTEDTSWAEAFWGKVQNQAAWQVLGHTMDLWDVKPVKGYDPFTSGDIKGYERYADDFAYVSSPREASLLKARIDRNNAREAAAQEELGFFGTLLTEAFNPVNYIPLPGLTGLGFAKGALVGGASVGALSLAEEAVRGAVDPTVNPNDLATNAMYSSIFGGLLGGGFGMIGAKSANKLASEAVRDFNLIEQAELGLASSGEPIIRSGNLFQARPTGDTKVGTASAGGFENIAKLTPYGRLKNMGIRAVEDLADALGGDFGTLSARNRVGGATQTSAFLASELWRGQAAEVSQGMKRAYQLFRTGGDGTGAEVLDINLPTAIQQVREFAGQGGDGMMLYEQFKAEVFKAALSGKTDDLPVGIKEGVEQVRKFFDYAGVEGSKTGLIRTAEGFKRMLASKTDRARQIMARYEELAAKPERSAQDSLEMIELARQQDEALRWFEKRIDVGDEDSLKEILARYDEQLARQRDPQGVIDDITARAQSKADEAERLVASIEQSIDLRLQRDRELLDELNRLYAERGLSARQLALRDQLAARLDEGIDVLLSTGLQRFVDPGGPSGVGKGVLGKFAEKVQQATNGPFFIINGLAMLTDITKRSNLVFINQFMMEDALKLAAGKGTKKDLEKLASYGLSLEDAKKIATMPFEKKGRVILPNVGEWPDEELARRYLVAVTGMSRRIVPTASAADLPLVARGFVAGREFPLLTLPFQFMNYGFASLNKIMLSALQGRDASPFKGAALLMGLAYMSQKLRTDEDQWERMETSEKLVRAFDQSGLTGVFSDIPSRVERASMGDLSLRGSLGLKPTVRNPDDWSEPFNAAGPVPGKVAQLVRVSIDGDATDRERANAIRRSIPLNNLIWWREGFDELETMAAEE